MHIPVQTYANDPWLTVRQAADRALCHEATIRRLIRAGMLRHARVGAGRKLIRVRAS
jgi:excisionase family DNA binding protein